MSDSFPCSTEERAGRAVEAQRRACRRRRSGAQQGPWIREGTHIDEAVYEAAKYLAKASNPDSRRIVVIVTDNLSNQSALLGHSESDAMQQLHESGAAVCGLVVGDFNVTVNEYKKQGFILRDSIGGYFAETGGILSQVDKDDVTAKLARLIERLRSRYSRLWIFRVGCHKVGGTGRRLLRSHSSWLSFT